MARRRKKDVTYDVVSDLPKEQVEEQVEQKEEVFSNVAYWRFKDPNKVYYFKGFKVVSEDLRNNQDLRFLFIEKSMEDEIIAVKN